MRLMAGVATPHPSQLLSPPTLLSPSLSTLGVNILQTRADRQAWAGEIHLTWFGGKHFFMKLWPKMSGTTGQAQLAVRAIAPVVTTTGPHLPPSTCTLGWLLSQPRWWRGGACFMLLPRCHCCTPYILYNF